MNKFKSFLQTKKAAFFVAAAVALCSIVTAVAYMAGWNPDYKSVVAAVLLLVAGVLFFALCAVSDRLACVLTSLCLLFAFMFFIVDSFPYFTDNFADGIKFDEFFVRTIVFTAVILVLFVTANVTAWLRLDKTTACKQTVVEEEQK